MNLSMILWYHFYDIFMDFDFYIMQIFILCKFWTKILNNFFSVNHNFWNICNDIIVYYIEHFLENANYYIRT